MTGCLNTVSGNDDFDMKLHVRGWWLMNAELQFKYAIQWFPKTPLHDKTCS